MKCPKCGGHNLGEESDRYGCYTTCLNCGYCSDKDSVPVSIRQTILEDVGKLRRREPSMTKLKTA